MVNFILVPTKTMGREGKTPKRAQIGTRHYGYMVAFPSLASIAAALGMEEAELLNTYGSVPEAVKATWGQKLDVWAEGRWQK